jgi:predicted flap endonuclease-1-like 5' DNA nuclease
LSATAAVDPDDLTKIEGVGKKIQEHLNNGGIRTFNELASSPVERLQEILDAAGPAYTMHDPETWPEQGALARDGKWEQLSTWQAQLKGGRKRKKR